MDIINNSQCGGDASEFCDDIPFHGGDVSQQGGFTVL